jgi:oligopeptide/dipeptide ABC transporter ATP-binding protein
MLISSLPSLETKGEFKGIPGITPSLRRLPPGCHFHPRCPSVMDRCRVDLPLLTEVEPQRWTACHLYPVASVATAATLPVTTSS